MEGHLFLLFFLQLLAGPTQWAFADPGIPVIVPRGTNFVVGTGTTDSSGGRPSIASDGTNFLATWRIVSSGSIQCARVTRDGNVLDANPIVVGTGSHLPSVAFDGTNYLLVWVQGTEIVGARVSMNGVLVDVSPLAITTGSDVKDRPIPIAFDGTNYIVAWRTNGDVIRALKVAPTGIALGSPDGFIVGGGFYPWVAAGAGQFVIVWHANGVSSLDVVWARYATDGALLSTSVLDLPGNQDHASVAFGGTNFLIAWHDWRNTDSYGNGQAYGVRLGTNGTILDVPPILIAGTTLWQVPVVTTFDGTDYFVAWHANSNAKQRNADVYGRRVSTAGILLEEKPIPLSVAYNNQWSPSIGAAGDRILAIWNDMRDASPTTCGGGCVQGQILERKLVASVATTVGGTPASGPALWTAESSPMGGHIYTISSANNKVYAAGESLTIIERIGGTWQTTFTQSPLLRMFGMWTGSNIGRTVGHWWGMRYFDSSQWAESFGAVTPYGIGFGIWGFGSDFAMVVGTEGAYQRYTNPTQAYVGQWEYGATGAMLSLYDVWGTTPSNIYAVGEFGTLMHHDGVNWAPVAGVPTSQSLNAVWGSAPNDIFVVGDFGTILHFNGSVWTIQPTPTSEHLYGVSGTNGNNVFAVGSRGTILHYDGTQWNGEASGTNASLFDVAMTSIKVWAVGESGTILARDIPNASVVITGNGAATVGANVTFTATVTGTSPTGTLNFRAGAVTIAGCGAVAITGNTATCTTNALPVGNTLITAVYSGDANNSPATSPAVTQIVNKNSTTTAIGSSLNPSATGAAVTFTASVAGQLPTGIIDFKAGGTTLPGCGAVALLSASAACTTTFATAGIQVIAADYGGDANNATSSGALTGGEVVVANTGGLMLVSVVSSKMHGASKFDLPINLIGPVTVEPRLIGSGHTLLFHFGNPVTSVSTATTFDTVLIPAGNATVAAVGGDVVVTLGNVADNSRITVVLEGLNGSGAASVSLGFLVGDVNNSHAVTAADISAVKANAGKPVDINNYKFDLNADGSNSPLDKTLVKARAGLVLP